MKKAQCDASNAVTPDGLAPASEALSLCGKGVVIYEDPTSHNLIVVPTKCHRWDCSSCGPYRALIARSRARAGRAQRELTLTLRPRPRETLAEQVDFIRLMWRRLSQRIRRNFGPFEWMASLELQKNRTPHIHILTRGCYIPQRWLSRAWCDLTGSFKVWIKKVDRVEGAIDECCKYMLKTAAAIARQCPGRPVYTMSRNWLPPGFGEDPEKEPRDPYACFFRLKLPDLEFIVQRLGGSLEQRPDRPGSWRIDFPRPPSLSDVHEMYIWEGDTSQAVALYLVYRLSHSDKLKELALEELQAFHGLLVKPKAPICPSDAPSKLPVPKPLTAPENVLPEALWPTLERRNLVNMLLWPDCRIPRHA